MFETHQGGRFFFFLFFCSKSPFASPQLFFRPERRELYISLTQKCRAIICSVFCCEFCSVRSITEQCRNAETQPSVAKRIAASVTVVVRWGSHHWTRVSTHTHTHNTHTTHTHTTQLHLKGHWHLRESQLFQGSLCQGTSCGNLRVRSGGGGSNPSATQRAPAHHAQLLRHSAPCGSACLGLEPIRDHGGTYVLSVNATMDMRETHFGAL